MVLIAVAGGTGTAGRAVVARAIAEGYAVRSLSRQLPAAEKRIAGAQYAMADFRTGRGVAAGLTGVDVLIETLDARSGSALQALPVTSVAVLAAAERAGVSRCVLLSIVRAAECSMGYYQAQGARAKSYESAGILTTVLYATQFHDLVAGVFAAGAKIGIVPVFRGVSFQPISTSDVAEALVREALAGGDDHIEVLLGGPHVCSMRELADQWKAVTGSKALTVAMPLPGAFGRFLRAKKNLVPDHAAGAVSFRDWLETRR